MQLRSFKFMMDQVQLVSKAGQGEEEEADLSASMRRRGPVPPLLPSLLWDCTRAQVGGWVDECEEGFHTCYFLVPGSCYFCFSTQVCFCRGFCDQQSARYWKALTQLCAKLQLCA